MRTVIGDGVIKKAEVSVVVEETSSFLEMRNLVGLQLSSKSLGMAVGNARKDYLDTTSEIKLQLISRMKVLLAS